MSARSLPRPGCPVTTEAAVRMSAALALSALIHAFFLTSVTPGSPGHRGHLPGHPTILVRLEPAVPSPPVVSPADAGPAPDAMPVRPRAERPRRHALEPKPVPALESASGGEAGVGSDPTYYAARALDVYPALAKPLELPYAARAAAEGIQGSALLLLLIDANGVVDDVSVVEAEPAGYFEDDARRAFLEARFTPARKGGRAVKSRVLVRVNYSSESARQ